MTEPRRLRAPFGALAALGLVVVLAGLAWFGAAAPLLAWRAALSERADTAQAQASRFALALAQAEALPAENAPPDAALAAPNPLRAAAALQSRLAAAVAAAGGALRSVQVLDPRPLEGAVRVAVTLDARFDAAGLRDFLHGVETGAPLIFVESLDARREPGAEEAQADLIAVRATLWAVAATEAPAG